MAENQQARKTTGAAADKAAETAEERRAALAEAEQQAAREAALPNPEDEAGKKDSWTAAGYAQPDDATDDGVGPNVDARVLHLAKTLEGYVSTNGQDVFDEALDLVRSRNDFLDSAERRARAAREDVQAGMKAPVGRKQGSEVKKTT